MVEKIKTVWILNGPWGYKVKNSHARAGFRLFGYSFIFQASVNRFMPRFHIEVFKHSYSNGGWVYSPRTVLKFNIGNFDGSWYSE